MGPHGPCGAGLPGHGTYPAILFHNYRDRGGTANLVLFKDHEGLAEVIETIFVTS